MTQIHSELVKLAHELGDPARDLAILGEGNVSAGVGDDSFWVKASGSSLATLRETDLSLVSLEAALAPLQHPSLNETEVEAALSAALLEPSHKRPSVETFLHALCLSQPGVACVGHTHAVAVNRILCSELGAEPFRRHIFPDAIVVCGPAPAVVPYADPGFALAKAVQRELERFMAAQGKSPKLLLMESHGPVALGSSPREVLNIMLMADKWARTLAGTYAVGGPRFLPDEEVARIDGRLDEAYRRERLVES